MTPDNPRILALETSSRHGSVAIALGDNLLETRQLPPGNRHAAQLMPALRDLTLKHGWRPDQIDELYLSLGPGSFTGLRIAVAIARAMHQAIGCKIVGVPTLDIIAQNTPTDFPFAIPLLDAKRSQVFAARYQRHGPELTAITNPALVHPAPFITETATLARGAPIALLGEGIDYHRPALDPLLAAHPNLHLLDPALWPPRAETVYHLGRRLAQEGRYADPRTLLPIYIRLPEAEEVWRKKHGLPL
ncbi:MAG: tRNA (adenosine(37)-N6)-threonylcarbamoyltransferase complex dimerization subunit type 1 TsaB [Phycisphaerae bacterium]